MMDVVDEEDEDDFVLGMRAAGRAIVHDIRDGEEGCDGEGYGVQDDMQCAEGEGDLDDEEARALDSLGRDGDAFLDLTYETSDRYACYTMNGGKMHASRSSDEHFQFLSA